MVGVDEDARPRAVAADHLHDPAVARLREPPAAELDRRRHPEHAEPAEAVDDRLGDLGVAVDRVGVDARLGECLDLGDGPIDRRALGLGQLG